MDEPAGFQVFRLSWLYVIIRTSLAAPFQRLIVVHKSILRLRIIALLAVALLPHFAVASCPKNTFTEPDRVNIQSESVMIVTHASVSYDARLASKRGVEQAIQFARSRRMPLIYLADDQAGSPENFFVDDCNPNYWVYSKDGEIAFNVRASHVYVVGGHLEVCLLNTLQDLMSRWARQPKHDLTVTYFMDGIYSNGSGIVRTDPYHRDFMGFIDVVRYGKPADEAWSKLTLLETMGLIINVSRQFGYAERILPFYKRWLSSDYRVEIKLNDEPPKILQRGRGTQPATLRFEFIDSAGSVRKSSPLPQST